MKITIACLFISVCLFSQTAKSPLQGKKIVTIGDSITSFSIYQPFLVDWLGLNWSKEETVSGVDGFAPAAIGGTVVRPMNTKSIFYRSFDVKNYKPDIIILFGSQNDSDIRKIGTINDKPYYPREVNETVTLAAAFQGMIENLMKDNPKAEIYLVTLMRVRAEIGMNPMKDYETKYKHPRFANMQEVLDWEKTERYPRVELVRELGKKYGLKVIDLYENSGITTDNAHLYYRQISDNCTQVHPNNEGYRKMAECMAAVLDPTFKVPAIDTSK